MALALQALTITIKNMTMGDSRDQDGLRLRALCTELRPDDAFVTRCKRDAEDTYIDRLEIIKDEFDRAVMALTRFSNSSVS